MPLNVRYTEDGGVFLEGSGVFTDKDLEESYEIIYETDDKIKKIAYQVFDVSGAEKIDISNHQVIRAAEKDRRALTINPDMRIAVFGKPEVVYGLGRMWETYACELSGHKNNCKTFRNKDDLMKWIKSSPKKS